MDKIDRMLMALDPTYIPDEVKRRRSNAKAIADSFHVGLTQAVDPLIGRFKRIEDQISKIDTDTAVNAACAGLREAISALGVETAAVIKRLQAQKTEIASKLDSIESSVINEIRSIPAPEKPEKPEKQEKPEKVELGPVLKAIESSTQQIMQSKKKAWTFEVKRNRAGFIEEIIAK